MPGARGPLPGTKEDNTGRDLPAGLPDAPEFLGDAGRAEWERMREVFGTHLSAGDYGALLNHCQAVDEIAEHAPKLRDEGPTLKGDRGAVLNPRAKVLAAARTALLAADEALGITAKARARLPKSKPQNSGKSAAEQATSGPEKFRVLEGTGT